MANKPRKDGESKYTVDEVLKSLANKRDCRVSGSMIYVINGLGKLPATNDLGNGSWGKISFLVNHRGYKQLFVKEFP